jgi:hypothetical protein
MSVACGLIAGQRKRSPSSFAPDRTNDQKIV